MSNVTVMNFTPLDFEELDFDAMNFETIEPMRVFASDSALRKLEALPGTSQQDRNSSSISESISRFSESA